MTVVVTIARPFAIVAASDSAVKEEIGGEVAYSTGAKGFKLDGIGVVTTWGARDGNNVGAYVHSLAGDRAVRTVSELGARIRQYLEHDYGPRERNAPDVGYHVAGFEGGVPTVYHIFWNAPGEDRPAGGAYETQLYRPEAGIFALYNGRDDLARSVMDALLRQFQRGERLPLRLGNALGMVGLAHLVLRFARELTFDVGPPFLAHVIDESNSITTIRLPEWQPVGDPEFGELLELSRRISGLVEVAKLR